MVKTLVRDMEDVNMNEFARQFALRVMHMNILADVRRTENSDVFIFTELVDVPTRVVIKRNDTAVHTDEVHVMVIVEITKTDILIVRSIGWHSEFTVYYNSALADTNPDIAYIKLKQALMIK